MDQSWDQQPGEATRPYHAFAHYRDLGTGRSLDKAWRAHKDACEGVQMGPNRRAPRGWKDWSVRFGWVIRAEAWDTHLEQQQRAAAVKLQQDARDRHARIAQAALTALTVPVRVTIEALQNPGVMQRLVEQARTDAASFLAMVAIVARVAGALPSLIAAERTALGLSTKADILPEPEPRDGIATRIAEDPTATDLAIALLDRIAGSGESPALGLGPSGEPGDVADGAAPQSPHP